MNVITEPSFIFGIVRPNDIHKLKKGMLLSVKYSNDTPVKIAVIAVNY